MQFRLHIALMIFLGSYLPLSVILLAQDYDYKVSERTFCLNIFADDCALPLLNPYYSLPIFVVCFVCFLVTLAAVRLTRGKRKVVIRSAKYIPSELMNYTLPYVVAFMSINYSDPGKFSGLIIFLGWMFWLTHKSGQLLFNPLLIAFGWRLYEISYQFPGDSVIRNTFALADNDISADEEYIYVAMQDVFILRAKQRSEEA